MHKEIYKIIQLSVYLRRVLGNYENDQMLVLILLVLFERSKAVESAKHHKSYVQYIMYMIKSFHAQRI